MTTSKLEKLNIEVSRLGFGAMRLPTAEDGKIDRAAAGEMVDRAYKSGVNYFDTAYGYHNFESELFLGEALKKYPRESFFLADKWPPFFCKEESDVLRIFNEQLEKCGVEYFDFYLLHSLGRENWDIVKKFDVMPKLLEQKKAGKFRFFGFSYHGEYDTFVEILDAYDWDFVQLQFNYIDEVKLEAKKFHDELAKRGIPCVVMEPVRGGFLANMPETAKAELAPLGGASPAEWALRWCIREQNTPVVLSGMSDMRQVDENVRVFSEAKALSAIERETINRVRDIVLAIKTVPCTGCAYCMECPSGVSIPTVMQLYNDYKLYNNAFGFWQDYRGMDEGKCSGESCVSCGECVPKCPQSINIPEWLATIQGEYEKVRANFIS